MFQQIVDGIAGLVLLGVVVFFVLGILSPFGVLWLWPSRPPREERNERVIIINNTPPAPSQPSAWTLLAPAAAALLIALTRRVESQPQALPAPDDGWVEVEPGRWVRPRQTAIVRQDDYRG